MGRSVFTIIFALAGILGLAAVASAQDRQQGETPLFPRRTGEPDPPEGVREMLERMRIEKAKKDYEEMIDRGEQAAKLAHKIESSVSKREALSTQDRDDLAALEKLTRQIVDALGGDEDDLAEDANAEKTAAGPAATAEELEKAVEQMLAELKKTTRFTVSAAAIESGGAVLRLAKKLGTY
ncbi:MAG: hypothetical protein UZ17_ACD001002372 [Acidobacteria bacterium OLB17]|nr:MAG: hypothetical protein UZ17_ACD001002372 [Acidobacteria bacterium OLB17]MCZ2392089.1 hypothetical protein [Acidobacteriota bacterium]